MSTNRLSFARNLVAWSFKGQQWSCVHRTSKTASFWSFANQRMSENHSVSAGFKVFVTRRVPPSSIELLKSSGCGVTQWDSEAPIPKRQLVEGVRGCDALFCLLTDRIDKEVLDSAALFRVQRNNEIVPVQCPVDNGKQASPHSRNLRVIGTMSVGYEHIDISECHLRHITVGYTPDVLTDATAELTMALLLATSRKLLPAAKAVKSGEWSTWSPMWMCGRGLAGSTIGIVGLGRIGLAVSRRLRPFGVKSILYSGHSAKSYASEVRAEFVPFESLLAESDFVIATCPYSPETNGLFNRAVFSKMKRSAIFINTSRGGVVNQNDLIDALSGGTIAAAGLDVTSPEPLPVDHPLLGLENCVVLPHIGSATVETRTDMAELTARNIIAALNGQPMPSELKA